MKKTLSLMLCLLLAISSASVALGAQQFKNEESGIIFTLPEGYEAEDISEGENVALLVYDPNEETIVFVYEVAYLEELDDVWLEDMSEEDIHVLAESMTGDVGALSYTTTEADGIHYMLLQNDAGDYACIFSLLGGWVCALYAVAEDGYTLTEAAWDVLAEMQSAITYE